MKATRTRPSTRTTVAVTRTQKYATTQSTHQPRSIEMHTMHEALARDRMREREQRSREARLAKELLAQRRWHRIAHYARTAEKRHAMRVSQAVAR